jgi:hypothetical protein
MIRVVLPYHLKRLARVDGEVLLPVEGGASVRSILDALERDYPMLRGTIRDHGTLARRPFLRYFACGKDFSLSDPGDALPEAIAEGTEPFLIVGAISGG